MVNVGYALSFFITWAEIVSEDESKKSSEYEGDFH